MEHRLAWVVAVGLAFLALVAGCVKVDVPDGPYVVANGGGGADEPSPEARSRVEKMDAAALEEEVLRLTAENDRLRQDLGDAKRKIKQLEKDKDRLEDRIDDLEDRLDD